MITHAQLLDLVHYDPDTGLFTVLKPTPRRAAGKVMNSDCLVVNRGDSTPTRQTAVYIYGHGRFLAGRLAWFYMTGEWPAAEIDHEDNNGWNQKWLNIRPATRSQNQANTRRYKSNSSGKKCVFRSGGKRRPWRAQIQKDHRRISLGRFETEDAAFAAVISAATAVHGEFARFS